MVHEETRDIMWSHNVRSTISKVRSMANAIENVQNGGKSSMDLTRINKRLWEIAKELDNHTTEIFTEIDRLINAVNTAKNEPTDGDIQKAAMWDCIRPEIHKLSNLMEQKFRLHDNQRGNPFDPEITSEFLRSRQDDEKEEMQSAIENHESPLTVWKEAADRCNFILMEAVAYQREWSAVKRGKREWMKKN